MTDEQFYLKYREAFRQVALTRNLDEAIEYVARLSFLQGQLNGYVETSKVAADALKEAGEKK